MKISSILKLLQLPSACVAALKGRPNCIIVQLYMYFLVICDHRLYDVVFGLLMGKWASVVLHLPNKLVQLINK